MMDDVLFARCALINKQLESGNDREARDALIQVLDYCQTELIERPPVVNALTRAVGLYPYLRDQQQLSWDELFLLEAFSANAGDGDVVLHREQANVLKLLLDGHDLALSAPTSFGKSFVIDAFIAIKKPKNVLIMVPTLALADETRRRLHVKFGGQYSVITATEDAPSESGNIFIFPQERAISYAARMPDLDLLIVDEFYKASKEFDKERSGSLVRAILKFSAKSAQRYFLAPNITSLADSPFTVGMQFLPIDFNTVFLRKHEIYRTLGAGIGEKSSALISILSATSGKTLVYAGTYSAIKEVANVLLDGLDKISSNLLDDFRDWLVRNYGLNWLLPRLILRGVGVHNGQLHRSLSQIQIRLFEEAAGLNVLLSTSSIIEGVNTSAQNVILWRNKNGPSKLTDFEYKNIIGRSGRMLRHFVGEVYILEAPPVEVQNQLRLDLPDSLLGLPDVQEEFELSQEQHIKADAFNREVSELLSGRRLSDVVKEHAIQTSNSDLIKKILHELRDNPGNWQGLNYLNSTNPEEWGWTLFKVLELNGGAWDITHTKFVAFTKILSRNWSSTIPELLEDLMDWDIDLDAFFKLERNVSYKLAALLGDVNSLHKAVNRNTTIDISSFVMRVAHAFLPPVVFELEEYGLPRMLSRKMQRAGVIDFESPECKLSDAISIIVRQRDVVASLCEGFERYIFDYFVEGVRLKEAV